MKPPVYKRTCTTCTFKELSLSSLLLLVGEENGCLEVQRVSERKMFLNGLAFQSLRLVFRLRFVHAIFFLVFMLPANTHISSVSSY